MSISSLKLRKLSQSRLQKFKEKSKRGYSVERLRYREVGIDEVQCSKMDESRFQWGLTPLPLPYIRWLIILLHFSQQGTEACLLKMLISGKGLIYPTILHDNERHAIGQAPLFVGAFAVHL